ncbi:interleukin-33 isoform X2 [Tamandua tetradactyla]|uniref:interleukin-33 isoform X2 n=1 Tax=Tamandua tetradactyla TaxID=48850 RepID=UPI0040545B07
MKPKMKPKSTTKISPAKLNNSTGKIPAKSPKLRKSQRTAKEVCQVYHMKLRSHIIKKKICYFSKKTTNRHPPKTGNQHREQHPVLAAYQQEPVLKQPAVEPALAFNILESPSQTKTGKVTERHAYLYTYNDRFISFAVDGEHGEVHIQDLRENQQKDTVLVRYHDSQIPSNDSGDEVDGKKWMVNLSPKKNGNLWLHANNEEQSVELHKCEKVMPERAFFLLQRQSSEHFSFECKSNPGVFIGVKNNQLELIRVKDHLEDSNNENIMFKIFQKNVMESD